jgi:hypothetical protein
MVTLLIGRAVLEGCCCPALMGAREKGFAYIKAAREREPEINIIMGTPILLEGRLWGKGFVFCCEPGIQAVFARWSGTQI